MFLKISKSGLHASLVSILLVLFQVHAVSADPKVRIDLELATQKKVTLAIADFVVKGADVMGNAKEAKKILKKDLILSDWFSPLQEPVFEELEKMERSSPKVDYRSWRQVGAQWLIKSEYSNNHGLFLLCSTMLQQRNKGNKRKRGSFL